MKNFIRKSHIKKKEIFITRVITMDFWTTRFHGNRNGISKNFLLNHDWIHCFWLIGNAAEPANYELVIAWLDWIPFCGRVPPLLFLVLLTLEKPVEFRLFTRFSFKKFNHIFKLIRKHQMELIRCDFLPVSWMHFEKQLLWAYKNFQPFLGN